MSKRQWLVLLMLFLTYLLLGASIFYHIESELEIEKVREARISRIEINALLHEHYVPNHEHDQHEILEKLSIYCGKSVYNYTENEVDLYKWDFYNSFYFAYTVVSTIGYGNLAPTNMLSRILMIFYGIIGIPMNGILLAQLGEFFGNVFVRAHKKYKSYKEGHSDPVKRLTPLETRKAGLAAQIFMYLAPGFVMFIFFPAFLFSYYEGWQYDEAVYYAFVTLTTIGFGDYVAGQDNTKGTGIPWILYKAFLIIWIVFGLGYLVMIMSFIAQGMRSKRITRIEHKLAMNLKHTQSKIWNEFNKDVNYLRRIFNELYMMKLKPVYRDEYDRQDPPHKFSKSHSFPDIRQLIYGGLEISEPIHPRRRANSEVAPAIEYETVNRVMSENDLEKIDKNATFASHAMVQPAELLARLINVLGYIPPPQDEFDLPEEEENEQPEMKGVEGLCDKDILAGEKSWAGSGWRIGGEKVAISKRLRASSEIRLEKDDNGIGAHQQHIEWTWSGPAASRKIQELMKARRRSVTSTPTKDNKSRLPSFSLSSVPKTIRPRWLNPFLNKRNEGEPSRRESAPADELHTHLKENYLSHTGNTRPIITPDRRQSAAPHYFTHTGGNLPNTPDVNLLEETSLADFLRALTALHSRVGAVPDDFATRPQRKLGTASLTPPKLPGLLSLFSPPPGLLAQSQSTQSSVTSSQMAARRFSLRPVDQSAASTPGCQRKESFVPANGSSRRFSLMPDENSSSTTSYQRRGSLIPGSVPRRFSLRSVFVPGGTSSSNNTPPYTPDLVPLHIQERQNPPPYSADPFVFECAKEPLVPAEVGPARDGISLPLGTSPVPRRFSLRPAQIGVPPAPASPKTTLMTRPAVPKWKGGMLQRQISELSLQRRARAFSLGDVRSIKNDRTVGQPSPLVLPNPTSNLSSHLSSSRSSLTTDNYDKANSQSSGKTVTIVTPSSPLAQNPFHDAKQTGVGYLNDKITQLPSPSPQSDKTGHSKAEQDTLKALEVNLTLFSDSPRLKVMSGEGGGQSRGVNTTEIEATPQTSESSDFVNKPSSTSVSNQKLTAIKIDDHKMSIALSAKDPSRLLELQSVVIDKPSSKLRRSSSKDDVLLSCPKKDSLIEVKVDPISPSAETVTAGTSSMTFEMPTGRKISMISQKSTESGETLSDGDKSDGRKISSMSQQSIELGSISSSRKSSTSIKSVTDKPRISIESYKPLLELKIEKPTTNPFEQYQAMVKGKFEKPREKKALGFRKISAEQRSEIVEGSHQLDSPVKSKSTKSSTANLEDVET